MKVLMLSQGHKIEDQIDFDVSFRNAKSCDKLIELINIPFVGYIEKYGCESLYNEIVRVNNEFRPDIVFFQFFHAFAERRNVTSPIECVRCLKSSHENVPLVFGSWGDPFNVGWQAFVGTPAPKHTYQLASVADAFFPTSMGSTADSLVRHGAKNVIFIPNAFCPMHFKLADVEEENVKEFSVVMLGSCCKYFHPRIYWSLARAYSRNKTVKVLSNHFGRSFAVYGNGWDGNISARGFIPFKNQMMVFKKSHVVVDAPAQIDYDYYTSDRAFFIAGSGTPLVMKYIYGLDKMLEDREHAYFVKRISDFPKVCEEILATPSELLFERRKKTLSLIQSCHMIDHRIDTIVSVAEVLQKVRRKEYSPLDALRNVRMHHFLPKVILENEYRHCVRNWKG